MHGKAACCFFCGKYLTKDINLLRQVDTDDPFVLLLFDDALFVYFNVFSRFVTTQKQKCKGVNLLQADCEGGVTN